MSKKLLWSVFFATVLVASLNYIGGVFFLYWLTWWFDMMMHTLGGALVGLMILWLLPLHPHYRRGLSTKSEAFWAVLLSVLVVGLLWEAFELQFGISQLTAPDFWFDSISDLVLDLIGAMIVFWYVYPKTKNSQLQS